MLLVERSASRQAEKNLTKKCMAEKYHLVSGVWHSKSRLAKEGAVEIMDLDCTPFFDELHIKKMLPVVLVNSQVFHALLSFVHLIELPHRGVEITLRRIRERFHPIGNARQAITKFHAACSKCRLLLQRTVRLELADFPN